MHLWLAFVACIGACYQLSTHQAASVLPQEEIEALFVSVRDIVLARPSGEIAELAGLINSSPRRRRMHELELDDLQHLLQVCLTAVVGPNNKYRSAACQLPDTAPFAVHLSTLAITKAAHLFCISPARHRNFGEVFFWLAVTVTNLGKPPCPG